MTHPLDEKGPQNIPPIKAYTAEELAELTPEQFKSHALEMFTLVMTVNPDHSMDPPRAVEVFYDICRDVAQAYRTVAGLAAKAGYYDKAAMAYATARRSEEIEFTLEDGEEAIRTSYLAHIMADAMMPTATANLKAQFEAHAAGLAVEQQRGERPPEPEQRSPDFNLN